MVDLILKIPPEKRLKTPKERDILDRKVMEKYPLMEIRYDEVLFKWVKKCLISYSENGDEITFSSNSDLYPYIVYAACAYVDILRIDKIYDAQDGKSYPLSAYSQIVKDVPLELEIQKKSPGYPEIIRLYPKEEEKFHFTQILKVIDIINKKWGWEVLKIDDKGRTIIYFFSRDHKSWDTFDFFFSNYKYIEMSLLTTEDFSRSYEPILNDLATYLSAIIKKQ